MANSEKGSNIKPTDYIKFVVEDGILHCVYNNLDLLDLDIAKVCVRARLEFVGDKSYPSLFDIRLVKTSTKEARDYLANEGNALVSASAILIDSPMLKMAANFYIMVNKPVNPTRMFTSKSSAVEWLAQYK